MYSIVVIYQYFGDAETSMFDVVVFFKTYYPTVVKHTCKWLTANLQGHTFFTILTQKKTIQTHNINTYRTNALKLYTVLILAIVI